MILRQIILGGLLLPLKIYFQPRRFVDEVYSRVPKLRDVDTLRQARKYWRKPIFRHTILLLYAQSCIGILFWAPAFSYLFSIIGFKIKWGWLTIGVILGVTVGAVVTGIERITNRIAMLVVLGIVLGVGFGVGGSLGFGIAFGVAYGVGYGFNKDRAKDMTDTVEVLLGVATSIAIGIVVGMLVGAVGSIAYGIRRGSGIGFTFGAAFSIAGALSVSHLLFYPVQFVLSGVIRLIGQSVTDRALRIFWEISPIRWDETIILPLPGLSQLLIDLHANDSVFGNDAIDKIASHRYQSKPAYQAKMNIAYGEALSLDTLHALANFEKGLNWLSSETSISDKDKAPLLILKEVSQSVDSADALTTFRGKISRLRAAEEKLYTLRHYPDPGRFEATLTKWQRLITGAIEKAREEQRIREPIRQVYFNDGKPISADELPEEELPFKGRMDTVRELEHALSASDRATLLLTGNRRSGKSSLLLQLPRKLGPRVVPAFIDCQSSKLSSESTGGLLIGLAETIVEQARRNADKHRRDQIRFPRLNHQAFNNDPYPAFARWLEGTERALGERQLLLCLDEFERLEEGLAVGRIDDRFLSMLRNIIQHHQSIIVLLSGSHTLDELPSRWADALITTHSLRIGFLDEADARELIEQPVKGFPNIYKHEAVEGILALTHSQPYLVQLLCGLLVEKMNHERREPPESYVVPGDVEAVIPQVLERGEAYFHDLWRSRTAGKLAQRLLEKMAFAEAERISSAEVKQLTEDEDALRDALRTLLRREIIERTADGYRITVPLIAHYVRSQRQPV